MSVYPKNVLEVFLRDQGKLYDRPVAETEEEADEYLDDCMAVVLDSIEEVQDYLEKEGCDVTGLSLEELSEIEEVFPIGDGTFLVVEG